ncbi:MAG: cbb3-type cytochrome c oxidase subunit 3 [Magnetococcales bacterium]|nr:cbb3-type cytochrome c oxidase subunit 3 [Magnetococcales bacterium]
MGFNELVNFSKQFGLVWFFLLFVAILVWAFWPGNKKRFEDEGRRILEDEERDRH